MEERRSKLSICAVIATRNEAHCLSILLPILAQQDIDVVIIDNESTDDSHKIYSAFKGDPVVSVESIPFQGYSLPKLLEAKQALYNKLDYDWFIHHDSDEVLEHRDSGYSLRDAVEQADQRGFNALNFEEFVFLPEPNADYTKNNFHTGLLRYYFFEPRKNRLNRAWKHGFGLDNRASGGHCLSGERLRVDPTNHILRHYIVYSQDHAIKKYLKRSYDKKSIECGWHANRLKCTKENLALPHESQYLFKLKPYDSKEFRRDAPVVKHYWQWNDTASRANKKQINIGKTKGNTVQLDMFRDYFKYYQQYKVIADSGLFDREYYLFNYLDVAKSCIDPIKHYVRDGWRQGKNPNPYFDTAWYLEMYPDVKESGSNPLYHYLTAGWKQGYDPSPRFSVNKYVSENPDLANNDAEPLCRFIRDQKTGPEVIDFSQLHTKVDVDEDFGKVAVHAHIYYTDLVREFVEYINHVPGKFGCFFTTDTVDKKKIIQETVGDGLNAQKLDIRVTPNVGRDIAPFFVGCRDILSDYDTVCHVHTKKALHTSHNGYGNTWRKNLLDHLLGTQQQVEVLLKYFSENPDVGLLFPMNFIPIQKYLESDINQWNMEYLAKRIGLRAGAPREIICPAGSMFWAKTKALCNLSDVELSYSEFDNEAGQLDGTLAHAFERLFVYIAKDNGFSSRVIGSTLN